MNNECGNKNGIYTCTMGRTHGGTHFEHERRVSWPQRVEPFKIKFVEPEPPVYGVKFTLEELKGLVYALSGPEWLEDEPELVAKIDKALKGAL